MSDEFKEDTQTTQQIAQNIETNDTTHINCMTLPKVILTRIDISKLAVPSVKKCQSPLEYTVFKKGSVGRPPKTKPTKQNLKQEKRKEQPKKRDSLLKSNNLKAKGRRQNILSSAKSPKVSSSGSPKASVKSMLNKTAIKKRNISSGKKFKQVTMKPVKQAPVKDISIPKPKNVNVKNTNTKHTDSSEDEFLYDELIEELENTSKTGASPVETMFEKTTNITLKPNSGNKAPTIVKGGIIKRTKLPADLQSVSSSTTNSSKTAKRTSGAGSSQSPMKKASPWPISTYPTTKINKKQNEKMISTQNPLSGFKLPRPLKPRIGPKQTLKVGPLFNSYSEDNSDEYSEIETLENDDLDVSTFSKSIGSSSKTTTVQNIPIKPKVVNPSKGDEDPNLDLIRILSDDPDDPDEIKSSLNSKNNVENNTDNEHKPQNVGHKAESTKKSTVEEDTSHVRTIYELMNEISLQHPSWNLHIVPETNAFCIVQVTKGRLGIPTMKKCIELDSLNFCGRVYIHQYHIKKFDGVYDSEESILALFQEIHSIKA